MAFLQNQKKILFSANADKSPWDCQFAQWRLFFALPCDVFSCKQQWSLHHFVCALCFAELSRSMTALRSCRWSWWPSRRMFPPSWTGTTGSTWTWPMSTHPRASGGCGTRHWRPLTLPSFRYRPTCSASSKVPLAQFFYMDVYIIFFYLDVCIVSSL